MSQRPERTTLISEHWAADMLHVVLWSPESELGVWISSHPNSGQRYRYFAAAFPAAVGFMAHPDIPTDTRLRRWTSEYGGFALRVYPNVAELLAVARKRGYANYALGRGSAGLLEDLRRDRHAHHELCVRDAECGRGWTDHSWIFVDRPDEGIAEIFHLNLNDGNIVPPTPVRLW